MASASSPPAETPNTELRSLGSANLKPPRRPDPRTASMKNLSCAANRSGSKKMASTHAAAKSRQKPDVPPMIIVDGTSADSKEAAPLRDESSDRHRRTRRRREEPAGCTP